MTAAQEMAIRAVLGATDEQLKTALKMFAEWKASRQT